jgi:UDP-N-acetyl-D-mannosaminuronic acid dehydrogenase
VPTPIQPDKQPDISYVEQATRSICKVLKAGDLVILESTSPVGTTQKMAEVIGSERPDLKSANGAGNGLKISMAYCPERILPGRMVYELVQNDRIVGGITPDCAQRAKELYSTFVRGQIFETSAAAAELVKLIENAYRDVNIAFANEVANICDHLGLDAWETITLANRHPRVKILSPGPGVGGHCIAVDPWFLITQYPELTQVMRAARNVNDGRPHSVVDRIETALSQTGGRKVCCLGLSYKADVDDLRESPAVEIVEMLGHKGYDVTVVEPHVTELPGALAGRSNIRLQQLDDAVTQSDVVALLVAHMPFRNIDRSALQDKHLVDCVGSWR